MASDYHPSKQQDYCHLFFGSICNAAIHLICSISGIPHSLTPRTPWCLIPNSGHSPTTTTTTTTSINSSSSSNPRVRSLPGIHNNSRPTNPLHKSRRGSPTSLTTTTTIITNTSKGGAHITRDQGFIFEFLPELIWRWSGPALPWSVAINVYHINLFCLLCFFILFFYPRNYFFNY